MIKFNLSSKTLNFGKLVLASMRCENFPLLKDVTDEVNGNINKCGVFLGGAGWGVGIRKMKTCQHLVGLRNLVN